MCTDHNRGNIIIIEFFEDSNICLIEKLLSSLSGNQNIWRFLESVSHDTKCLQPEKNSPFRFCDKALFIFAIDTVPNETNFLSFVTKLFNA